MNSVNNNPSNQAYIFHALSIIAVSGYVITGILTMSQDLPTAAYATLLPSTFILALVFRSLTLKALYNPKKSCFMPNLNGFGITWDNLCDFNQGKRTIAAFFNIEQEEEEKPQPTPSEETKPDLELTSIPGVVQKSDFMARSLPEFEPSEAGAEAGQLEQVGRCRRVQRQGKGDDARNRVLIHERYTFNAQLPGAHPIREIPSDPKLVPVDVAYKDGTIKKIDPKEIPELNPDDVLLIRKPWTKVTFKADWTIGDKFPKEWFVKDDPEYVLCFPRSEDYFNHVKKVLEEQDIDFAIAKDFYTLSGDLPEKSKKVISRLFDLALPK